jgi:hypothetical protein
MEAPKPKIVAQFKMAAKIWFTSKINKPFFLSKFILLNKLSKYLIFIDKFFSRKLKIAPIFNIWFFLHLFQEALTFVRNFKMLKFLLIFEK